MLGLRQHEFEIQLEKVVCKTSHKITLIVYLAPIWPRDHRDKRSAYVCDKFHNSITINP